MTVYKLGEMFSGPGGIAAGAKSASREHPGSMGIEHSWAVDYDSDTAATYARNITGGDDSSVFTADVREFDLRQVRPFNAFAFGFPCNDFSLVGQKKGLDGEYGPLYSYGVHALALNAPDWFVAENVSGIRGANGGLAFGKILSALQSPSVAALEDGAFRARYADLLRTVRDDLEYDLVAHLYKFEEYGVPQKRHRVLVVGIRKDIAAALRRPFMVPQPTSRNPRQQKTSREAIELVPIPDWATNNERPRHPERVVRRLEQIEPGRNAFNTSFEEGSGLALNVRGATLSNIYRRLDPDSPAYTVTGSGGGGTHMYHWNEPRALTNRERARLQTFDDDFVFEGSKPSVRRQIGMAVPPDGAAVVFRALLNTLEGRDYPVDQNGPNINASALIAAFREGKDEHAVEEALPPQDRQSAIPGLG
ncbi:DNA cytosine methyltransferase [Brachybacterium muris]|uniref:DNA (cytosine-5-)-methyltransferase n=1 Tax=Brachybacterium muris UCD-AY4 TaxID=1249481 RepID=A0A022KT16_9MICO|nr:DNA cytosine methyltransferase [Brachybacterium muris]EYT48915.1 cytosine methyltransferase [Brachybacterium muris UCD-AY4]